MRSLFHFIHFSTLISSLLSSSTVLFPARSILLIFLVTHASSLSDSPILSSLEILDLTSNNIGSIGCTLFATALRFNATLGKGTLYPKCPLTSLRPSYSPSHTTSLSLSFPSSLLPTLTDSLISLHEFTRPHILIHNFLLTFLSFCTLSLPFLLCVFLLLGMLNLDGNPVGLAGGTALIETFNHHTRHRTIMLHACTYPSDSKAGTGKGSDGR